MKMAVDNIHFCGSRGQRQIFLPKFNGINLMWITSKKINGVMSSFYSRFFHKSVWSVEVATGSSDMIIGVYEQISPSSTLSSEQDVILHSASPGAHEISGQSSVE